MSHLDTSTSTSTGGGAGGAKREGKEEVEAVQAPSPFDRLPDELLCRILTFADQHYDPIFDTWPANKRLYQLLLGVCAASLKPSTCRQASLLQRLVYWPDLQPLSSIATMFRLLRLFPAMTDLDLGRVALSDTYGYKACPHPSTSIDFYTTHPTLLTLLYFLRHTKVVRFGWTRSYKVRKSRAAELQ
ncbi:hypothetical protein JCM10213_003983 [Rhodosporidiobolus nylandii]